MLYKEIIAVCSEVRTKHTNTMCGQSVELLNVKTGGTYSNHCALKDWSNTRDTGNCSDLATGSMTRGLWFEHCSSKLPTIQCLQKLFP